jgi:hypothetical protein
MKKQIIKINENQLQHIVAETAKKILKEGTTNMKHIEMFDYLIEMCGAEQVLRCIFDWSDSNRIEQWLEWFKEEGYFDGSQFEYEEENEPEEEQDDLNGLN